MAPNTFKCNHLMPLHFKGTYMNQQINNWAQSWNVHLWRRSHGEEVEGEIMGVRTHNFFMTTIVRMILS